MTESIPENMQSEWLPHEHPNEVLEAYCDTGTGAILYLRANWCGGGNDIPMTTEYIWKLAINGKWFSIASNVRLEAPLAWASAVVEGLGVEA